MPLDRVCQPVLPGRARGANRREDAAAGRVELLVRRPARAQLELADAVAREARVRVAVDEARDGRAPAPVDLDHLGVERSASRSAIAPDRDDPPVLAEHVARPR